MSRIFVFDHPIFLSGSYGVSAHPKTAITNRANISASVFTDQDISTTGNPTFNETNFSGSIDVADGKWLIQKVGDAVTITPSGSFNVTGSVGVLNNLTIQENLNVGNILNARDFVTKLETASTIFPSGSTKFGDDTGDKHPFSGSVSIGNDLSRSLDLTIPHTGSGAPTLFNITEFRNIPFPSAPFEQTQPVTEYAGSNLIAPFSSNQRYNRKCFAKKLLLSQVQLLLLMQKLHPLLVQKILLCLNNYQILLKTISCFFVMV